MSVIAEAPANVQNQPKSKVVYIDNLKVMLTALVILHHACVTYGGPGSWYYSEKTESAGAIIPMTIFVSTNQAFFMGFFFFLSALFIPASLDKKGSAVFVKDRLLRFGVPLLFYSFVLSPFMNYLVYYYGGNHPITFLQFLSGYDTWISFGVMWFVLALLLFTGVYILIRRFQTSETEIWKVPSVNRILLVALGVGFASFLVRIIFPVGWVLNPFGFQLGHFPQYITMFILGLVAANSKWLDQLEYSRYKKSATITACLILIGFPVIYTFKFVFDSTLEWFSGGFHPESLLYASWEQLTGFTICTALLCFGKQYWNTPSVLLAKLSRCSFAVYILHPLVLISLSLIAKSWAIDPAFKFLIVGPLGVLLSFLLGHVVVKIRSITRLSHFLSSITRFAL